MLNFNLGSILAGVERYEIVLERPSGVFFAGESVNGVIRLQTKGGIQCRGVRVALLGRGSVQWTEKHGDDDDDEDFSAVKTYAYGTNTVLGNLFKTDCLDGAGTEAFFNPLSGVGDMLIKLDLNKDPADATFVLRVMDYDWGKKDDLLGETLVRVGDLLAKPGAQISFGLRRGTKHKPQGQITVAGLLKETPPSHAGGGGLTLLKLRVFQATGLPNAEWFGKNDVYVQAYVLPNDHPAVLHHRRAGSMPEELLPEPERKVMLPAGSVELPFSIDLPVADIPSSNNLSGVGNSHVTYSLYTNIDIKWGLDPSSRKYLTVMSASPAPPRHLGPITRPDVGMETIYGCDCWCFKLCEQGGAQLLAGIDRTYASPGEEIFVAARAANGTPGNCSLVVSLTLHAELRAFRDGIVRGAAPHIRTSSKTFEMIRQPVPPQSTVVWEQATPQRLVIPLVPPTFNGIPQEDAGRGLFNTVMDPYVWTYTVDIKLDMANPMATDIVWSVPFHVGAVPTLTERVVSAQLAQIQDTIRGQDTAVLQDTLRGGGDYAAVIPAELVSLTTDVTPSGCQTFTPSFQEDKHNVGGAVGPFSPAYVIPATIVGPTTAIPAFVVNDVAMMETGTTVFREEDARAPLQSGMQRE